MSREIARRIPVVYKGQPLMPMRWGRAVKYVKLGKAKFRLHRKLGIKYLELLEKPCDMKTQTIVLGFDPGSVYDGFSVVSDQCHHENFELIHNKNIKKRMDKKRMYRRLRRGRLRNRPAKFGSRIKSKMVPTIRSMYNYRVWFIGQITKLYPISTIIYEKLKFNFYRKNYGKDATHVMTGITKLVEYFHIKNLVVIEKSGEDTCSKRLKIFGEDLKCEDKSEKSFFAHCIDSYSLALIILDNISRVNKKTRFINKLHFIRRELYQEKKPQSSDFSPNKSFYKIFREGHIVEYLNPYYGKRRTVKIQKYPNSFTHYITMELARELKYHKIKKSYARTSYNGVSKFGIYKNIETKEIIVPTNSVLCRLISNSSNKYCLLGFKRRNIKVTSDSK